MLEDAVNRANTSLIDVRRKELQNAYDEHQRGKTLNWLMAAGIGPVLDIGMAIGLVPAGVPSFLAIIATGGSIGAAGMCVWAWRLRQERVYVGGSKGNDPEDAIGSIDALIIEVKRPDRDMKRMQRAFDVMVDRLQNLVPAHPLGHLQREGYYPSRPLRSDNNGPQYYLDHDSKDATYHWNRTIEAVDVLRDILSDRGVILESQVRKAVAKLVPPFRAYLRDVGVRTYRIEYLASRKKGDRVPPPEDDAPTRTTITGAEGHRDEGGMPAPRSAGATAVTQPDRLGGVENRLNASGMMAAVALRTLILAFETAEPALFMGDDRETGELLIERHLPQLERAFIVADDAAKGEERDQVRMDFARALGVLRDTLDGIMARHVQAARDLLRDQARFIEERHGKQALSPD